MTDTVHNETGATESWMPRITAASAMAVTLLAAALAVAGLLSQDLDSLPPFGDVIWHVRLLFANFLIIVIALLTAAAWILVKNGRELHELRKQLNIHEP